MRYSIISVRFGGKVDNVIYVEYVVVISRDAYVLLTEATVEECSE